MTVNLAYIADIAPEFASADSSRVDRLVAIATLQVPIDKWGAQQDLGVAYLVAHMLKLGDLRGAGAVTAEAVGDLSRSYGGLGNSVGGKDDDDLELTSYGRTWKRLRRSQANGGILT